MCMKVVIFAILAFSALAAYPPFPKYLQCDERWGNEILGTSNYTICDIGCLISSVSSMLNGYGILIEGQPSTPHTINQYLINHDGYNMTDWFIWTSLSAFGFKHLGIQPTPQFAIENMQAGNLCILHVQKGHHYVLATGITSTGFTIMDALYPRDSYNFDEVVDASCYSRTSQKVKTA